MELFKWVALMSLDNFVGWHVVFTKTNKRHWLLNWLGDISHCYAYALSPGGSYYIVINSAWSNITVDMLFTEDYPDMKAYTGENSIIIPYDAKPEEKKYNIYYSFFGIFTCVSVVKRQLGIHKRRIITPRQLMRYIQNEL